MKRIGILTSGGDASGMNAAVRATVRKGLSMGMDVYAIDRGFEGLLDGNIEKMQWHSVGDILQRGGTILRTARSERFRTEEGQERAVSVLDTFGIEGVVVIGGDGSFRGGMELSRRGVHVMGIPGTIDNDLVNTVLAMISNIRDTSSAHERTSIIEVMGRHCGDIALHAGLAGGADDILIPEIELDINRACRRILRGQQSGKRHSIIIKAEGVPVSTAELRDIIEERTGQETRAVVPGHIQRGGTPSRQDRVLASLMGAKAAELLYDDEESKAIGITGGEIRACGLEEALQMKREFNPMLYDLAETLA